MEWANGRMDGHQSWWRMNRRNGISRRNSVVGNAVGVCRKRTKRLRRWSYAICWSVDLVSIRGWRPIGGSVSLLSEAPQESAPDTSFSCWKCSAQAVSAPHYWLLDGSSKLLYLPGFGCWCRNHGCKMLRVHATVGSPVWDRVGVLYYLLTYSQLLKYCVQTL